MTLVIDVHALEAQAEEFARSVFGPTAYVRAIVDRDPETGEPERVLEVWRPWPAGEDALDRLCEDDDRFLDRFVTELPVELSSAVSLDLRLIDADRA